MRIASVGGTRLFFNLAVEVVPISFLDTFSFDAGLLREVVDQCDDLLDRGVRGVEGFDRLLLGDFLGAGLDHHQAVFAAGDDEVELAFLPLLERRIDDVLPVDQTDPDAGDRLFKRDLRDRERRRRARDGEHVGVVLRIGGEHERDDLRFVPPARRKERPNRPVDAAAREHFLLGRLAFALEEAAGDASRCVGVFAIVDRQRQEVDAFPGVGGAARPSRGRPSRRSGP